MEMRSTPRPRGRVPKRPRTKEELAEHAQRFGADWRAGDNVMTWIRRHEATNAELSRLVRDGWSWNDVGLALALAGIKYQTGPAISGDVLRRKAEKARADERKRQANEVMRRLPAAMQSPSPSKGTNQAPEPTAEQIEPAETEDEPEFLPARLKGWSGTKLVKNRQEPTETKPPAPAAATEDAAEIIARLLGKT